MKIVEQKYRSEGYTTSLVAFDPARNLYVFDVYIQENR